MTTILAQNVHAALPKILDALDTQGRPTGSRNGFTSELLHATISLEKPWQRFIFQPHRNADPAALVAETFWVLAGRNDIQWLSWYLPRAADFSDDGKTWRAAYGPRLRAWDTPNIWFPKVDQLDCVIRALRADPDTRRAVISLWDPTSDWDDSKDIPCNNWLHFLIRDNQLHLSVAIRSNDIWWGWSGINTFEWSVLQEIVASAVGVEIGPLTTFSDSFHLYTRHFARASHLQVDQVDQVYPTDETVPAVPWVWPWESINNLLHGFSLIEGKLRRAPTLAVLRSISGIVDPFLRACVVTLAAKNLILHDHEPWIVEQWLLEQEPTDFRDASLDWVRRLDPARVSAKEKRKGKTTPTPDA